MNEDFFVNLIKGFSGGLGLGATNHEKFQLRRKNEGEVSDILGLFGELVGGENGVPSSEGAPLPQKEALLSLLSPGVFSLYKKYREGKKKTIKYDEPWLYWQNGSGERDWLGDGSGGKIKNSFYKPKVVDRFNEWKDGKQRRVYLYEDGKREYHDFESPPEKRGKKMEIGDPVEFEKKLIQSYKQGKITLKDYELLKKRNRERMAAGSFDQP
ncbi:MAG: hypothetical protein J0L60_06430 [Ignavibacteria bacterium]|nr:hypothetical protein [Ignavibacteria bacterium]